MRRNASEQDLLARMLSINTVRDGVLSFLDQESVRNFIRVKQYRQVFEIRQTFCTRRGCPGRGRLLESCFSASGEPIEKGCFDCELFKADLRLCNVCDKVVHYTEFTSCTDCRIKGCMDCLPKCSECGQHGCDNCKEPFLCGECNEIFCFDCRDKFLCECCLDYFCGDHEFLWLPESESALCKNCASTCQKCNALVYPECWNFEEGGGCPALFCPKCEDMVPCSACAATVCQACSEETMVRCDKCSKPYCIFSDMFGNPCTEQLVQCGQCDEKVCLSCRENFFGDACDECNQPICLDCLDRGKIFFCDACDKWLCTSHANHCVWCDSLNCCFCSDSDSCPECRKPYEATRDDEP